VKIVLSEFRDKHVTEKSKLLRKQDNIDKRDIWIMGDVKYPKIFRVYQEMGRGGNGNFARFQNQLAAFIIARD
jgi:hypothetical protein